MIHKPFSAGMGKDRAPFISPLLLAYVQPLSPSHRWDILARKTSHSCVSLIFSFLFDSLVPNVSTKNSNTRDERCASIAAHDSCCLARVVVKYNGKIESESIIYVYNCIHDITFQCIQSIASDSFSTPF